MKHVFRLLFVILAFFCLFVFSGATCDPTPVDDPLLGPDGIAFYTVPSDMVTSVNGDLIQYRPSKVPSGIDANGYVVMYQSVDAEDNANVVTGTVLVPKTAWAGSGTRPIVTYAVGTHGLCQKCAPSIQLEAGTDYEISNITKLIAAGYAVVMTDNAGYTTGDSPTYMVGISQGHAVLDIVKAAAQITKSSGRELPSVSSQVAIWGYSQGGQSAAWAGQLLTDYAPDLNVVGVAAGGIPANLTEVARYIDGKNGEGFLLSSVVGLWTQYPDGVPLDLLINDVGSAAVAQGKTMCVFEMLFTFMNHSLAEYVTDGTMTLEKLLKTTKATLGKQTLGFAAIPVPTFLYHGTADEFIPLGPALDLKKKYCDLGVNVRYLIYPGAHIITQFQAAPEVLAWIADRFNGVDPTSISTCTSTVTRPVSDSNPTNGDYIVSLKSWTLGGTIGITNAGSNVEFPVGSTFSADTNMSKKNIVGNLYIPPWHDYVIAIMGVNMTVTQTEPMTGAASLDYEGMLHVHGHMFTNIVIDSLVGIPSTTHTSSPVDFAIDFDGPVSSLGDGNLIFSGVATFPEMVGGGLAGLLTSTMSGDNSYTFIVTPPKPYAW